MAQDPEQQPKLDDAPDPQFPYGATPQEAPSYISPEFYAVQQTAPAQQPEAQSGYTVPTPAAYESPSQNVTPQPPYGSQTMYEPPQRPYGAESNYGHGGPTQGYGYGHNVPSSFALPQATPLPLGEAIRRLPAQYWKVITRPASMTFAEEMGKARWNIVWVQIGCYIVIITLLGFLSNLFVQSRAGTLSATGTLTPDTLALAQKFLALLTFVSTYGQVFLIPLSLFVGTGILFLLAKAFGGDGKFLSQLYSTLLFVVPLGIIVNIATLLLSLLPTFGSLLSFLILFGYLGYEGTLLGLMLMPVHRLSGGRAAGAVLLLFGVALVLSCVLGFIAVIILTATLRP
ncbi:MAG: hypothetical protein NVS4B11_22140 [Ktedonobacteraceae bacterium]